MAFKIALIILTIPLPFQEYARQSTSPAQPEGERVHAIVNKLMGPTKPEDETWSQLTNKTVTFLVRRQPQRPVVNQKDDADAEKPGTTITQNADNAARFDYVICGGRSSEESRRAWLNGSLKRRLIVTGLANQLTAEELGPVDGHGLLVVWG